MKKIIFVLMLVFISSLAVTAPASGGPASARKGDAVDSRSVADQLVRGLFEAYQGYNRPRFEALVSDRFMPVRAAFLSDVDRNAVDGNILEMHYTLNEVWTPRGKIVAAFSWEKKTRPVRGTGPVLSRGSAKAVFANEKGVWRLIRLRGDSPF